MFTWTNDFHRRSLHAYYMTHFAQNSIYYVPTLARKGMDLKGTRSSILRLTLNLNKRNRPIRLSRYFILIIPSFDEIYIIYIYNINQTENMYKVYWHMFSVLMHTDPMLYVFISKRFVPVKYYAIPPLLYAFRYTAVQSPDNRYYNTLFVRVVFLIYI